MPKKLRQLLEGPAEQVAPLLLGSRLIRTINDQTIEVRIVEVEAYHQTDAASHSYNGQTPRTSVMFGPAGHLYVYFTYGMHYCCNIVTGTEGEGSAVLIRAVEPMRGEATMHAHRAQLGVNLCNGPAKLCQALAIDSNLNGHNLSRSPLTLHLEPPLSKALITTTTRIGISKAQDTPWRFYIADNSYVSRP